MQQFYTYIHCKPNGEPFYVGKGHDTHKGRRSHDLRNRNAWHKRIVAKHGCENIRIYRFFCETEEQAFADEIQQIAQLKREGFKLCNLTDGGDGASGTRSEEWKHNIGKANKGKPSWKKGLKDSPDTIAKRSASLMGKGLGRKHTPETIAKIANWRPNEEQRTKLSIALKGRVLSDKAKKNMAIGKIGNKNSLGRKDSPETIAKRTASLKAYYDSKKLLLNNQ